jgi:hypothetical protein
MALNNLGSVSFLPPGGSFFWWYDRGGGGFGEIGVGTKGKASLLAPNRTCEFRASNVSTTFDALAKL